MNGKILGERITTTEDKGWRTKVTRTMPLNDL
jgi:hypothetical protein